MELLCHRGVWATRPEQNTMAAMTAALALGHGLETDVRDQDGRLVISHDPAVGDCPGVDDLLDAYQEAGGTGCLALNIKADGLAAELKAKLDRRGIGDYFVFDMSIPETIRCRNAGLTIFQRVSEHERVAPTLPASGAWVDAFEATWFDLPGIEALAAQVPALAFVSPELHGRGDAAECWALLREAESKLPGTRFLLCTDKPDAAARFFAEPES